MPLTPSRSPWWTVSTRTWPGIPSGSGAWRRPMFTAGALRLRPGRARGAVGRRAAQVVDVAVGDRREPRVVRLAEHLELAPRHLARGEPGHLVERLVHLRQPPDVRRRVPPLERPPAASAAPVPDRAGLPPLPHQPLHLLGATRRSRRPGSAAPPPCRACRDPGSRTGPGCPARSRTPRRGSRVGSPRPRCLRRRREAAPLCVAAASGCPRSSPDDAKDTRFTLTSRWNRPFASPSLRVGQYARLTLWVPLTRIPRPARRPVRCMNGASPSGKAPGFDPGIRRFESCRPSHSRRTSR